MPPSGKHDGASDTGPRLASALAMIDRAHADLAEAIAALEQCSDTSDPAFDVVLEARWRLGRAERERRTIVHRAFDDLAAAGVAPAPSVLKKHAALRREIDDFRSNYVRQWTPATMRADWQGYRRARAEKCRRLIDSIIQEKALFQALAGSAR